METDSASNPAIPLRKPYFGGSRKMRVVKCVLTVATGLFLVLAAAVLIGNRTAKVPLPDGVTMRTKRIILAGRKVTVDLYLPSGAKSAPVVVVAHGFARTRKNMAGWGGLLATNGFIAAVPDLPGFLDYKQNSRVITDLLSAVQSGTWGQQPAATDRGALVGFSMGGLSTLLAASNNPNVSCWVGIDCANLGPTGLKAAGMLQIPSVVLRAEIPPLKWQRRSVKSILDVIPGSLFALQVKSSTHCDGEHPSNAIGEFVCGRTDTERRDVFEQYALAALRSACFGDRQAFERLQKAPHDAHVTSVIGRKLEKLMAPH